MKKGKNEPLAKNRFQPRVVSLINHLIFSKNAVQLFGQTNASPHGGFPQIAVDMQELVVGRIEPVFQKVKSCENTSLWIYRRRGSLKSKRSG